MNKFFLESDIDEICKRISKHIENFSGKTILLTGGKGFLGRYIVEVFKKLNHDYLHKPVKLIVLDNLISSGDFGLDSIDDSNIEFIQHNVIKKIEISEKLDYIIHAAGIASPQHYKDHPLDTLEISISGTKNMLELAKKNNSNFTFFSSSEIYGDPVGDNIPTSEEYWGNVSTQGPRACYDEGKRTGETLCYIYHHYYGVKTTIARPFNFFGPGMQEKDYRVLPNFASRLKNKKPLNVYGTGNQTRTYCYITDAITGIFQIFLSGLPGETYNIGNPTPEVSAKELVQRISKSLEREIPYHIIEYPDNYPSSEPNRRCPSIMKAKQQINYEPKVDLDEGLRRFFLWTEENYTITESE
jgi:UDP-glucuronate decarboxylase